MGNDIIDDLFRDADASRIQTPKIGGFSVKTINILGGDKTMIPGTCGACSEAIKTSGSTILQCNRTLLFHTIYDKCDIKEGNMEKPRICEVLGVEVNEEFTYDFGANQVNRGTFKIGADGNRYYKAGKDQWNLCYNEEDLLTIINHPDRIIRKPRFTKQDVEDAKAVKRVFGRDGTVKRLKKAITDPYSNLTFDNRYINEGMFPCIFEGQEYTLDEIIGGVE